MDIKSSKIRVVYDEWPFQHVHGGVPRMYAEIMKNLPSNFEWILASKYTVNQYLGVAPFNIPKPKLTLDDLSRKLFFGFHFRGEHRICFLIASVLRRFLPCAEVVNYFSRREILSSSRFDLYHITAWEWRLAYGKKPMVTTACDLTPLVINGDKGYARKYKELCKAVDHIIAISETTKNDLIKYLNVPPEKITVVYLGYNSVHTSASKDADWFNELACEPYVLFVGKRAGYKNFEWMVRAMSKFLRGENGVRFRLFCTGSPFDEGEKKLLSELGVADRVFQRFVSDEEMALLFSHAACFVFPSKYEGFGIPILDAFSAGCPMILSRASCFPEVAGDAALYFTLDDVKDFQDKIMSLFGPQSASLRTTLIERGHRRVQSFSWSKCALETARVYEKVLKRR